MVYGFFFRKFGWDGCVVLVKFYIGGVMLFLLIEMVRVVRLLLVFFCGNSMILVLGLSRLCLFGFRLMMGMLFGIIMVFLLLLYFMVMCWFWLIIRLLIVLLVMVEVLLLVFFQGWWFLLLLCRLGVKICISRVFRVLLGCGMVVVLMKLLGWMFFGFVSDMVWIVVLLVSLIVSCWLLWVFSCRWLLVVCWMVLCSGCSMFVGGCVVKLVVLVRSRLKNSVGEVLS